MQKQVYIPPILVWKNETVCYVTTNIWPVGLFVDDQDGTSFFENILNGNLTHFNIQLFIIISLCNAIHFFLRNLGITSFVSQCLAGVILGPTVMAKYGYYKEHIFNHGSQDILNVAARMGYSLFLFTIGVKTDVGPILKSERKIKIIGIASVLVPNIISLIYESKRLSIAGSVPERILIMAFTGVESITAFPVVFHLLVELKLTNSELGRLALSCSLISGLMSACLEVSFTVISDKNGLILIGVTIVWVLSTAFVLHPIMMWVVKRTPPGKKCHPACLPIILTVAFIYQIFFDVTATCKHLGPLVVGLAVPVGTPLGSYLVDSLETITSYILFPLFVVTSAMRAGDIFDIFFASDGFPDRDFYVATIFVSFLVKFAVCLLLSLTWMPPVDSAILALIMSSKGVYELGIYSSHRDYEIASEQLFSLCLTHIILNATLVSICVKYLYDPSRKYAGYKTRNLFGLKPNTELKVLICMHKPHHIGYMINLLDFLRPTADNQIWVYALHLVELVGRATPMLISHDKQRVMSDNSSIEVIIAFNQFERRTFGRTTVNTFTSISQPKFMQDDICTLALDKSTSLILIPFHITWAPDGIIESEETTIRMVNSKVLDRAPCSVGIFFNRGNNNLTSSSSCSSMCVIYIGGRDDHEALCVATRMVRDDSSQMMGLTILHLIPNEHSTSSISISNNNSRSSGGKSSSSHERLVDDAVLEQALKEVDVLPNVEYIGEVVEDGNQTAMVIRSHVEDHDFFVVGRRHGVVESPQTAGLLDEWSEFPELGVIGDLLASKNMNTNGGVLVVQQQRQMIK